MFRSVFRRLLTVVLALSLALGQGLVMPAMAASMTNVDQTAMSSDMPSATGHEDCCPMCDKDQHSDHGMKGSTCAAVCAAMTQAALPTQPIVFIRHAIRLSYDLTNTVACGRLSLPDYRPPKV